MYAIIQTGGKQYKVNVGDELRVEKLEAAEGSKVQIPTVAVIEGTNVQSSPKSTVTATVIEHGKGPKLDIFKYKPKKNYRRRQGHRQPFTKIKITAI